MADPSAVVAGGYEPTWKLVPDKPPPQHAHTMLYTPGTLVPVGARGHVDLDEGEVRCKNVDDPILLEDLVEGRGYADKVGNDRDGKNCYVPAGLETWAATHPTDPLNRDPMTVADWDMLAPTFVELLHRRARIDCGGGDASRDECLRMGTTLLDTLHSTIDRHRDGFLPDGDDVAIYCSVGPKVTGLGNDKNEYDLRMFYSDHTDPPTDYESDERTAGMISLRYTNDSDAGSVRVSNLTQGAYTYSNGDNDSLVEESRPLFERVGLEWRRPNNQRDAPYNLIIGTIVARLIECATGRGMGSDLVFDGPIFGGGDHEASARLAASIFGQVREDVWRRSSRSDSALPPEPPPVGLSFGRGPRIDHVIDSLPTHFQTHPEQNRAVIKFKDPRAAEAAFEDMDDLKHRGFRIRRGDSGPLSKDVIDRMVFNNFFASIGAEYYGGEVVLPLFHGIKDLGSPQNRVMASADLFHNINRWNDGTFSTMRHVTKRDADVTVVQFNDQTYNHAP